MVVVTSTTTKVHVNGDTAPLASRPSSLFGRSDSAGASGFLNVNDNGNGGSVLDSASRVGLDYIVENPDYVHKLASALESKSLAVKKQVFELLSALSVYSAEGYARTLQALDAFKAQIGERYRFKFLVAELRGNENEPSSLDYKTSILAFINCLILASPDTHERIRTRCEFIGLRLIHVLNELRSRHANANARARDDDAGLIIQLDVFDEQKESDESQQLAATSALASAARGIDLTSPLEVFDVILRQITGSPQEVPFLCILQHLVSIDNREPISDLIWDAAERLVHRATLLESRDDALRLLKAPSHAKSLQKMQPQQKGGDGKCSCSCHANNKSSLPPNTQAAAVPMPVAAPAPPPPPPAPPVTVPGPPPPPSPPCQESQSPSNQPMPSKPLPKLPQQSLPPVPKAKMKTINWNKIPNGQILNGAGQNLWTTFSKKQAVSGTLIDWQELEGLFCLQNEGIAGTNASTSPGKFSPAFDIGKVNVKEIAAARAGLIPAAPPAQTQVGGATVPKRETSELILLDAKRSLNINIFLKQFRGCGSNSIQEIVQLILKGASQEFGVGADKLRGLLKLLPSADEVEMLNLVSKDVDQRSRLASAEKFLLALIQIDNYRLRVEAMLLREELEVSLANIDASIGAILTAASDVKASEQFQEVIFMILVAGNFLNSGGYAGDAAGVKLSSLQKIGDIRGNKPGISLLHFIVMQAEARDPKLVSFVNEMPALEEASKTSIEQLKVEITSLNSKVQNLTAQIPNTNSNGSGNPTAIKVPRDILQQYGSFLDDARAKISDIEAYFGHVERARVDLAQFFCEELASFKIEDCFKIILGFVNKWRDAAADNGKRKKQEQEAEARRKAREEQFRRRAQQLSNEDMRGTASKGGGMTLNPDDDLFIACSPRIVRRRLGSLASHDNMSSGSTQGSNDQLTLPSPDITPNGSIRKRRSRLSSDEDESNLMDFLRSSGGAGSGNGTPTGSAMNPHIGSPSTPRKLPGSIIDNQYGSLDRSWSRGTRRRPNLMEFVNSDRERPISPATHVAAAAAANPEAPRSDSVGTDKHESPTKEWRERITAWFVDLENGGGGSGSGDKEKRRPAPPRRFQSRFGDSVRGDTSRGLATLPEVEPNPDEAAGGAITNFNDAYRTPFTSRSQATAATGTAPPSTYERVYPDRRPSLKVNTDVVSAMEAIEGVQTPVKEKSLWRTSSISSDKSGVESPTSTKTNANAGRRSLIGSLGSGSGSGAGGGKGDEKLTLYIPESKRGLGQHAHAHGATSPSSRSPEVHESEFGTKEGFDRFASIRRSRRIKKAVEPATETQGRPTSFGRAPPGPDTPIPSRRFVSKVDITDEPTTTNAPAPLFARTTKAGTLQRTSGATSAATNIRYPRATSMIDSKHVDAAMNLHKNLRSSGGSAAVRYSNAIPIPNGHGHSSAAKTSSLSTSPAGTATSAENDEGFEESPNSLTETGDRDLVLQNNLNNRLRRSFRETGNSHRKSRQENAPVIMDSAPAPQNITTSTASRRPLNNSNGSAGTNGYRSTGTPLANGKTNGSTVYRNGGSEISHTSTPAPPAPVSKSARTPRILSFMRPTASSSAKDKLDAKAAAGKGANAGGGGSVALYSNKRAFK